MRSAVTTVAACAEAAPIIAAAARIHFLISPHPLESSQSSQSYARVREALMQFMRE
jgi:hypothetical protein